MKKLPMRQLMLFSALVASLGAAVWVGGQEDVLQTAAPVERHETTAAEQTPPVEPQHLALERLNRRTPSGTEADPFRVKTWYVAPPPPPPAPPPKPTAPALSFKYMGSFEDPSSGKLVVYLARGDESFPVSPGDKFDEGKYSFDGIDKGRLTFTYLPLTIKQTLTIDTP